MAVRELDGVDDNIVCAIGALTGMTHGTVVTLLERTALTGFDAIHVLHTSGGTRRLQVSFNGTATNWYPGSGPTDSQGPAVDNTTDWWLVIARKPTGTVAPRFSVRDLTTGVWTHGDGANALPDSATPGAGGTVRFTVVNGEHIAARLAARAAWSNTLPWSADAAGDAAIEAAGLETSYQNWINASPDAAWRFNQASVSTPVPDDTGNGADQTAITGTTVVTGDDPPGFSFDLGGITGAVATTEGDDTLAASGAVTTPAVTGTIVSAELDDQLAAAGTHVPPAFSGTVAATEAADTLAAVGTHDSPGAAGSVTAVEQPDTLAAAGSFTPGTTTGAVAVTEADDALAAAGTVDNSAVVAPTPTARTLIVAAEPRTVTPVEPRTIAVPEEPRLVTIR